MSFFRRLFQWLSPSTERAAQSPHSEDPSSLKQSLARAEAQLRETRAQTAAQSQYLDVLMHELKNPLSVVTMALETGANNPKNVDLALRAAREMHDVLDRTLWMDRLADGRIQVRGESFDVVALIQAELDQHSAERFDCDLPASLVVASDPGIVRVVMRNLLSNATKFSDPSQAIRVSLREDASQGQIVLAVSNVAGPAGLPDPERMFEKYYRAPGAGYIAGSGLGMHMCKALAQTLGARLSASVSRGVVTFTLAIPRTGVAH